MYLHAHTLTHSQEHSIHLDCAARLQVLYWKFWDIFQICMSINLSLEDSLHIYKTVDAGQHATDIWWINVAGGKAHRNQEMKNEAALCYNMLHLLCCVVKCFITRRPFLLKKELVPNLGTPKLHFHCGTFFKCPHIFSLTTFQPDDLNLSK